MSGERAALDDTCSHDPFLLGDTALCIVIALREESLFVVSSINAFQKLALLNEQCPSSRSDSKTLRSSGTGYARETPAFCEEFGDQGDEVEVVFRNIFFPRSP